MAIANRPSSIGMLAAPIHTTKAEAVAEWIRGRIFSGEFEAGMSLQQEDIARTLEVSSTPVREAFLILEAEAYVERRPHRGVVVADPPLDEIEEIRQVRSAIERVAVERICQSLDPSALVPLQDALLECRLAIDAGDAGWWQRRTHDFHHAIAVASGSKTIADMSSMLFARARRYLPLDPKIMTRSHEEHEEIVKALESRDADRALEQLRAHETLFRHTVDRAREEENARRASSHAEQ